MDTMELRRQVCATAKKMEALQLVDGTAGNISVRVPGTDRVIITPTTLDYDNYTPERMCVVDLEGRPVEGELAPSSETPMHTMVHRYVGREAAVIHTHSPYATTFAALGEPIPVLGQEGLGFGQEVAPVTGQLGLPGTALLGQEVLQLFNNYPDTHVILLRNHGVLVFDNTLAGALDLAGYLEFTARIYYQARLIGKPLTLSAEKIKSINENYKKMHAE